MTTTRDNNIKFTPSFEAELKKGPVKPGEKAQIINSVPTSPKKTHCDEAFFKTMAYNLRLYQHNPQCKKEEYLNALDFPACAYLKA